MPNLKEKMQPLTKTRPVRLLTVDALRGFALLGIMVVHFQFWYTAGPLPPDVYGKFGGAGTRMATLFSEIFLSGKFFAFFSFLFGLSFYLQTGERGRGNAIRQFAWRITLLLAIGLVHHAFWQGDILSIYAPLGFLLLLARRLSNRWVLFLGCLLVFNLPGKVVLFMQMVSAAPPGEGSSFPTIANEYHTLVNSGSWLEIFRFNLGHLQTKFAFQIESGRLFVTLGFFLLGMFVGRKKWFERGVAAKHVWRILFTKSLVLACSCVVSGLCLFAVNGLGSLGWEQNPFVGFFFSFLFDAFNAGLVVVYVSGLSLLMFKKGWQQVLFSLVPVGKMALTSYLTQTLVGLLLFWHVGMEWYTKTSPGLNFVMAVGLFVMQVVFSRWWLQKFQFGPAEWVWRSATLLNAQPMKRKKAAPIRIAESIKRVTATLSDVERCN